MTEISDAELINIVLRQLKPDEFIAFVQGKLCDICEGFAREENSEEYKRAEKVSEFIANLLSNTTLETLCPKLYQITVEFASEEEATGEYITLEGTRQLLQEVEFLHAMTVTTTIHSVPLKGHTEDASGSGAGAGGPAGA